VTVARRRSLGPIILLLIVVGLSGAFFVWVLHSPDQVRVFLIRLVLITLVIFLGILLIRFFTLLWFGFLQHAERDIQGDRSDVELPPVSVLVPAYNEGAVLERAIQSLLRLDYPEYEILIIDDGSPDNTLATASALEGVFDGVPIRVFSKPNGGKATALNLGIDNSVHPFILCMDADSTVEPQLLRRAMPHFEDPTV
jgi:biofilm PGA synthesis N-glycosyltransferase PgaC